MAQQNTFKLGITVIFLFLLFLAAVLFIGGERLLQPAHSEVVIRFRSGGAMPELGKGSFVTYFGQKVGVVHQASIVADVDPLKPEISDRPFLEIRATLYEDLDLRQDCVVQASGPPLGGGGQVNILRRGLLATPIAEGQPIYGQVASLQAALDLLTRQLDERNRDGLVSMLKRQLDESNPDSLIARIQKSVLDVNAMTASLRTQLDPETEDVLLAKLHLALDRLNTGLVKLTDMIDDNRPRVDHALTSLDNASTTVEQRIVNVLAGELELPDNPKGTMLSKIHQAMDCLNESLQNVQVASDGAKEVVVLNKDQVGQIISNVNSASASLKQGVKDVVLHPWRLFKPGAAVRRDLQLVYVAREFSEAAAHLDESTLRLKALLELRGGSIVASDPELQRIRSDLSETLEQFNQAEQALWTKLNGK